MMVLVSVGLTVVIAAVIGILCLGGGTLLGKVLVETQLKKANKKIAKGSTHLKYQFQYKSTLVLFK